MKHLDNQIIVSIKCLVYNHAPYIRQCLDGFVMQKTNFAFEAIVHDDASTDGTQDIIREYAEKYPDVIKPIYETENQYSKRDGSLRRIMNEAISPSTKYIALCEGDDYWIDPYKLQKQVDFLETHPDYTMVCNRTKLYSEKKKAFIGENYCYNHNCTIKTKDVIYRSGLFISTCSIIYRKEIKDNYPDYCIKCAVGDYPLQIMAAMKGKVYYFNNVMSVYRVQNSNSWMGKQEWRTVTQQNLKRIDSMINMFKGFSKDYPKYEKYFSNKIAHYLVSQSPFRFNNNDEDLAIYLIYYKSEYKQFPLLWKILHRLKMSNIPGLRGNLISYEGPFFKKFRQKKIKIL